MKAVVKTKPGPGIEVLDLPVPPVGDTDILVKLRCGSVCGSDVHIYEGTAGYEWLPLPVTLGHEFSGEVVETGAHVREVKPGDRITTLPMMPCSRCDLCRIGKGEACGSKLVLGLLSPGAFAEYVRITAGAAIFRIPEGVSDEAAALCEPLAVALNAVELSGIKPGQNAAVLGPGPIGLLTLQALKAAGASAVLVAGTGADAGRLAVAARMGADVTVDVDREDPVQRAAEIAGSGFGAGLDLVFEATGNPTSVSQALSMVKGGGKVVLIGIHAAHAEFSPTDLVRGRKSLIGAYAYEAATWQRALALLASGRVVVQPMITHTLPLARAEEGFELAVRKEAAKVVLIP